MSQSSGGRDFSVHAYLGSLPPRAGSKLAVRIEQLLDELGLGQEDDGEAQ